MPDLVSNRFRMRVVKEAEKALADVERAHGKGPLGGALGFFRHNDSKMAFNIQMIGAEIAFPRANRNLCIRNAQRLIAEMGHITGYPWSSYSGRGQSDPLVFDPEGGGAIYGGDGRSALKFIASFAGLGDEHLNETVVLLILLRMEMLTMEHAIELAMLSKNTFFLTGEWEDGFAPVTAAVIYPRNVRADGTIIIPRGCDPHVELRLDDDLWIPGLVLPLLLIGDEVPDGDDQVNLIFRAEAAS